MKSILKYKLSPQNFIEELLIKKGIENTELFLYCNESCEEDVYHLDNINQGIQDLKFAIQKGYKIGILVDEDADGFLSSALLYFFFKYLNYDNIEFIFHQQKSHGIILEEIPDSIGFLICPDAANTT